MMEYATRCAVTIPLPVMDTETLATALLYDVVLEVWHAKRLITDNGSNLTSDVMQALTRKLQVRHATTSVEHPQTDGLVERLNRTIKTALTAYVELDPSTWEDKLPFVTFAYNTATQESTRKSALEVLFGRKAVLPTTADLVWSRKLPMVNTGSTIWKATSPSFKLKH
jgi:hypothetical protein